jgi:hypothetical protein
MVSIITYRGSKRDRRRPKEQNENIKINNPCFSFSISFFFSLNKKLPLFSLFLVGEQGKNGLEINQSITSTSQSSRQRQSEILHLLFPSSCLG